MFWLNFQIPCIPWQGFSFQFCLCSGDPEPFSACINYGEGGGGATKWEYCGSETFCAAPPPPPPQVRVKLVTPPPPSLWLKLQAPMLKPPQNFLCPPFRMAKTFSAPPPPFFVGVKLHMPSPLLFCSPPPPPPPRN